MSNPPSPPFTLRVEDLGRLSKAEVDLRPLTLFVGENNSGKTYLATLIWALYYMTPLYTRSGSIDSAYPQDAVAACARQLEGLRETAHQIAASSMRSSEQKKIPNKSGVNLGAESALAPEWMELAHLRIRDHINGLAGRALGASWLKPTFSSDSFHSFLHNLSAIGYGVRLVYLDEQLGDVMIELLREGEVVFGMSSNAPQKSEWGYFIDLILSVMLTDYVEERLDAGGPHEVLFFPASRTGIVQNLPLLTERQLRRTFNTGDPVQLAESQMPAAVQQFLRFLVNPGRPTATEDGLDELIERHVIGGRLQHGVGIDYTYTPQGHSQPLSMSQASAVVTELLPLWLLVSTGRRPPLLVYEEPEAHLHPRLQRVVAVLLARLARQGTKVLVTTHSETFAQQINNLIKRSGLDPETRDATAGDFPYVADDYLSPDDVAGYEFRFRDDGRSYTERLEVRPDGIVMPMFNKELLALTDEAIRLDEALATKQAGG